MPLVDDFATEDVAPPQTPDISAHTWTESIIKELLACLHDALSPSTSALPHLQLPSSPLVDSQAVVDVCSLIFTLVTRCRNPKIPLIFIIHGDYCTRLISNS